MKKVKPVLIAAYAEPAAGPGWANTPIWLILQMPDGNLVKECIQPEDQTVEMHCLYNVSNAAHYAMVNAVKRARKDLQ